MIKVVINSLFEIALILALVLAIYCFVKEVICHCRIWLTPQITYVALPNRAIELGCLVKDTSTGYIGHYATDISDDKCVVLMAHDKTVYNHIAFKANLVVVEREVQ